MFAILYRDILLMRKSLLLMLPILLFIGLSVPIAVSGVFLMISIILSSINFGYDEQSHFLRYGMSMPLGRRDYVLAKFLPSWILGVIGGLLMYALGRLYFLQSNDVSLLIGTAVFLLTVLFTAMLLTSLIRFGPEKGRIALLVMYFGLFGLFSLLGKTAKNPEQILGWLYAQSIPALVVLFLVVGLGLTAICYFLSIRWMQMAMER